MSCQLGYTQQLEYGPMLTNPSLQKNYTLKQSGVNIDSTFVFSSDTLQLPLFDDFSSDKFQAYTPNFSDPNLTSILYYQLT